MTFSAQHIAQHSRTGKRMLQVQLIHPAHQRQIRGRSGLRAVVHRRARQIEKLSLANDRQFVVRVDHRQADRLGRALGAGELALGQLEEEPAVHRLRERIPGRQLAKLHKNVVVKIQMTTEGLKAIKALSSEGVKINTTLIFSSNQAILAAKAGAKYVSPFIGRLEDMGQEGRQVIREIFEIFRNYDWDCEVLVASIRHPLHVIEAAKLGADVVTMPFDVLKKMTQHALTDVGLKRFLDDWAKVPK